MAEWSNAHDSKSCDAGMYPRVQIPFSAPSSKHDEPCTIRQTTVGLLLLSRFLLFPKKYFVFFRDCFDIGGQLTPFLFERDLREEPFAGANAFARNSGKTVKSEGKVDN